MSKIKECFVSRFGPKGMLLEVDFSQLEVVGVAMLSGDKALTADLCSGADLHKRRASELFGVPESAVTKAQRQIAKAFSFQLQYGAGAESMAKTNKVDVALAKAFIENYYGRYSELKAWQDDVAKEVSLTRQPSSRRTAGGLPSGRGTYESDTGRVYSFFEYDPPSWADPSKHRSRHWFSPTETKNYPSQGFATGDIMAVYRAIMFSYWLTSPSNSDWLPVNTIHDSVFYDCASQATADEVLGLCRLAADGSLPVRLKDLFGITCTVPFKVEGKMGRTWADMK